MVEGHNPARSQISGRSSQNKVVNFTVNSPILPAAGSYMTVRITQSFPNSLLGEAVDVAQSAAVSAGEDVCVA
jgi:tRNA-2-methylthio-N6-dimethylallyladenosine synthase